MSENVTWPASDNTSHVIWRSKLKTCTDKLTRPIDLFDPWEAAFPEMCYLGTRDYKSMFFYQSEEQAK